MTDELIYKHFTLLYKTDAWNNEVLDEIILFSFCEISNSDIERIDEENFYRKRRGETVIKLPETKLLKIRQAPRKFRKHNLINVGEARVYYWSNQYGAHVMTPFWTEKNQVLTMDVNETIEKARKQAKVEGLDYENPVLLNYLESLNSMHIRYHFEKNGYVNNADAYAGDWGKSELSVHFLENSFHIDDIKINKLLIASHWEVEEAWSKVYSMLSSDKWSMAELGELIKMLDTYDTSIRLYYIEGNEICLNRIRMDGGRIKNYEHEKLAPEIISAIEEINARKS